MFRPHPSDAQPNDSETRIVLSEVPAYAGNPEIALEWATRAVDREIRVPIWYYRLLGLSYSATGNCEQAIKVLERITWVGLDTSAHRAACYVELDRLDDARAVLARLLEQQPGLTAAGLRDRFPYKDQADRDWFFLRVYARLACRNDRFGCAPW